MNRSIRTRVETFLLEHQRILWSLDQVEAAPDAPLPPLQQARDLLLGHFEAKELFYPALTEHLMQTGDLAGAQLARIFEQNMKIQSTAVQRFFESLDRAAPAALADGFQTVASVIRQRLATEEKVVFPLTVKKEPSGNR